MYCSFFCTDENKNSKVRKSKIIPCFRATKYDKIKSATYVLSTKHLRVTVSSTTHGIFRLKIVPNAYIEWR